MRPILILILVVLGGAGTVFLLRPSGLERRQEASSGEEALLRELSDSLAALQHEVEELRASQEDLTMRIDLLESLPEPVAARTPVPREDPPELDEMREMVAAMKGPEGARAAGLETFVLDVLDQKEEQEARERRERREAARQERLERRIDELTQELGLSSYQSQELRTILDDEAGRRDALFLEMRESGDWDRRTVREAMGALRESTYTALGTVLTPEQLDGYRELDRWGPGPGPGGGAGGRPGGGPAREGGGTGR